MTLYLYKTYFEGKKLCNSYESYMFISNQNIVIVIIKEETNYNQYNK